MKQNNEFQEKNGGTRMKKWISLFLIAIMLLSLCLSGCGGKKGLTLNVYNWG